MATNIKAADFASWHPSAQMATVLGIPGALLGGLTGAVVGEEGHRMRDAMYGALQGGLMGAGVGAYAGLGARRPPPGGNSGGSSYRDSGSARQPSSRGRIPRRPDFAANATTKAEAKKAWRAAARENHPDYAANPTERAQREARMKAINDAWQRWTEHAGSDYHKMASLYGDGYVHAFTKFAAYRGA